MSTDANMSTDEQALNPAQLAKQLAKEQRKAKAAVEQAEKQKEKEARKQRNLELARVAKENKEKKKQEVAEKMVILAEQSAKKREESRILKEANLEKMRLQQEAKKVKDAERSVKREAQRKIDEENARLRAETTVLVSLDQQALMDQIKLVAESSSKGAKVAKINLISVGSTSQVTIVFDNAQQAKSFLASKPDQNDLLVKMDGVRAFAGAKRTCYFSFDHEPHGDRASAQTLVAAALKKAKIQAVYTVLRGAIIVVEFASEQETEKAVKALTKGSVFLGTAKNKTVIGQDAAMGNPPKRVNKKRNRDDMQLG